MDFLESKNNNLLQRLRELQSKQCCLHINEQIGTWYQKAKQELLQQEYGSDTPHSALATATKQQQQLEQLLQQQQQSSSTTASASNAPGGGVGGGPSSLDNNNLPLATTSAAAATAAPTAPLSSLSTTLDVHHEDNERTIGCFLSNIKHLERFDSDATESTSSNDSYDELESFSHEDIPTKRNTLITHSAYKYPKPRQNHHHASASTASSPVAITTHSTNQLPYQPQTPLPQQTQLSSPQHQPNYSQQQQQHQQHNQTIHQRRISNQQHQNHASASTSAAAAIMNSQNYDPTDLKKKAIWKWANERSRLASRWTWLQAQIADLEFRIRGQNDATMHARAHKTPPLPPVIPENCCSRTVPLSKDFRRRRLIKSSQILSNSNKKLVKFSHVPCICSSLPQTVAPCLSCNGRYNYLRQIDGENAPIPERVSLLDPCCHPVLSFPDDVTLGSQLSYLLKQETINRKPTMGKRGRKKGSTAANLAAAAAANAERNGKNPTNRKYYNKLGRPPGSKTMKNNQSRSIEVSNKLRRKYRTHSNSYDSNWNGNNNHQARRNKRIRRASSINESSVCSETSNQYRPNHFSNHSSAQNVTRRRRSEQSAYDIDNIVIPVSLAATTRVEILEYKEIMTPSWRVWENGTVPTESVNAEVAVASADTNANPAPSTTPEDVEDTSDEAYILRHSKGESEEKKRFTLKVPA